MGAQENQILRDRNLKEVCSNGVWRENCDESNADSISMESSSFNSIDSGVSSSSSELIEDASSSSTSYPPSSSSSSSSNGPLYELSELMAHLPIKRGLSMFYEGKSQSFTSLASVKSLEDLAKRTPQRRKMKSCKSYGGSLDGHKLYGTPKAIISKKASRGSSFSSSVGSLLSGSRPSFPVQKNF